MDEEESMVSFWYIYTTVKRNQQMKKTTILIALLSCAGLVSAQDAVPSVSEVTAESDVHVVSQLATIKIAY